jgi:hypothetical protein
MTDGGWRRGQLLQFLVGFCFVNPSASGAMDPLRGEYGFLTQFDGLTVKEARQRVISMVEHFGILEFQFYDAFEGYSHPPSATRTQWTCAAFNRTIRKDIVEAYVDQIREAGGRSWLYVQAMGRDPTERHGLRSGNVIGQHVVNGQPLLDVVVPNSDWAQEIAYEWAEFAKNLGFSGIHWDTLGDYEGFQGIKMSEAGADMVGFLREALPILREQGLAQTANFVDGFGWDRALVGVGWLDSIVAFPYWEVWTVPEVEDRFFNEVRRGGVFVCYPGKSPYHTFQRQNREVQGMWPMDVLIARWKKARCRGSTYLAIGDGYSHIQNEYFPDTVSINTADVRKIQDMVFAACDTPPVCPAHMRPPLGFPLWAWPVIGVLTISVCLILQREWMSRCCTVCSDNRGMRESAVHVVLNEGQDGGTSPGGAERRP